MKTHNIQQQLESQLDTDCFYFYDWFCEDSSLERKCKQLLPKVKKFVELGKIDQKANYFWFKNNCPMNGKLYDDFRISDRKTNNVIWTVIPESGHTVANGKGELWGKVNNFQRALVVGSFNDILEYIANQ
jgi:hypothetical protein